MERTIDTKSFIESREYYKNIYPHNIKKVCYYSIDENGDKNLHSFNGEPANIEFEKGNVKLLQWYKNGKLHNYYYAANIEFGESSINIVAYDDGEIHSSHDMPARVKLYIKTNGESYIRSFEWYHRGKFNRDNNEPTRIFYRQDLGVYYAQYFYYNHGEMYRFHGCKLVGNDLDRYLNKIMIVK